jgi:hypothetical protein
MATARGDQVERSGTRVETKERSEARPMVMRVSAALPAVIRVLGFRGAENTGRWSDHADGVPSEVEGARAETATQPRTSADRPPWLAASFVALVIAPILAASIHLFLFASNQFVSEVRFAARGNTEKLPGTDALGTTAGLAYLNSNQEVYAIADYIRSRSALDDVGKTVDLREAFRAAGADWYARLRDHASSEDLLRY